MTPIDSLAAVLTAYAEHSRVTTATVSKRFLGRSRRLSEVLAGSDMGVRHIETVLRRVSSEWPPDADWPHGVPRPAPIPQNPDPEPMIHG